MENIGPNCDLAVRKTQFANAENYKIATKQPKVIKKKENKNTKIDSLGQKKGRIFIDQQDINIIGLKKRKVKYFIKETC